MEVNRESVKSSENLDNAVNLADTQRTLDSTAVESVLLQCIKIDHIQVMKQVSVGVPLVAQQT